MNPKVVFTEEALGFIRRQPRKAQEKISYNIRKIEAGIKENELFKKIEGTQIWEIRTLFFGISYRLFSFWDTEDQNLIVATHGIMKKAQKTPEKEILKAEKVREQYYIDKQQ